MNMIPVIAIVGRPNVGKSTLFNCLTRTQDALVSDMPGMTRDRQYGEAEVADYRFIVIDTGGLTTEKSELDQLTVNQAQQAMMEADQILFVVDGREGITASDKSIAEKLRSLNKSITLVVNKMEDKDPEIMLADFFGLGFGTPQPISAAHRRGITELVQHVFQHLSQPEEAKEKTDEGIKLAIVGRPNVGKSTLINRMLGEERVIVSDQPGTTRDSIFVPLERHDKKYTVIDTAGIRRRGKIFEATEKFSVVKTLKAVQACHVVLFIMDAHEGVTDQDLKLLGFVLETGKSLVIAINKWDGLSTDEKDRARSSIDRRLNFVSFAKIHFISALHGTGVGNLFDSINEAYVSANKKLSTPLLTKVLQEAVNTHTPPLVQGRRIKLRYAHAGGHNPPRIVIHGNQVASLPDSYRRYLSNYFQQALELVGTPVRVELKSGENPYKHKKNPLTKKQQMKKKRKFQHVKKSKKKSTKRR
jgi:GTP-binding protein